MMKFLLFLSVIVTAFVSTLSYEDPYGYVSKEKLRKLTGKLENWVKSEVLAESNGSPKSGENHNAGSFFPFFRVGRSRNLESGATKRGSKMTVFPRVGRDSPRVYAGGDFDSENKRSDSNTALWFGPRLGVHKRDEYDAPLTYILLNDGHGTRTENIPYFEKDFEIDEDNQRLVFEPVN
ncbi:hypothetical protein HHI36_010800 [Cryptolaemus montrouzieri]|uniref:Uncharacterized protein n=1 Tax=Cryptolaemus montrouzieri TaxID=559131 RepID=A0ABD2MK54_9CUCU